MIKKIDVIEIEGVRYVPETVAMASTADGMRYCIIRCHDAGVHSGYVAKWEENNPRVVKLVDARRLWRWYGKTLSGLAIEGTTCPQNCKFSDPVPEIILLDACEIIPCTEMAMQSLKGVAPWKND